LRISDILGLAGARGSRDGRLFNAKTEPPLCALALVVRHESEIMAGAAALLAKGSLTGGEAHRIFNCAYWPAAALAMMAMIGK
jgi:hypothetical protein